MATLHRATLSRLSRATKTPVQGVQQGGKLLRSKLSSRLRRTLKDIDVVSAFVRHLTVEKVSEFLEELDSEIAGQDSKEHNDHQTDQDTTSASDGCTQSACQTDITLPRWEDACVVVDFADSTGLAGLGCSFSSFWGPLLAQHRGAQAAARVASSAACEKLAAMRKDPPDEQGLCFDIFSEDGNVSECSTVMVGDVGLLSSTLIVTATNDAQVARAVTADDTARTRGDAADATRSFLQDAKDEDAASLDSGDPPALDEPSVGWLRGSDLG